MNDNDEITKDKKIKTPNVDVKEGKASKIADGVVKIEKGIVETVIEITRAPLRAGAGIIDGAIQGVKQGSDQADTPIEKVGMGVAGATIGIAQGAVKGLKSTGEGIGVGLSKVGDGFKQMGEGMHGKSKQIEEPEDQV